jgi:hypothetical protein
MVEEIVFKSASLYGEPRTKKPSHPRSYQEEFQNKETIRWSHGEGFPSKEIENKTVSLRWQQRLCERIIRFITMAKIHEGGNSRFCLKSHNTRRHEDENHQCAEPSVRRCRRVWHCLWSAIATRDHGGKMKAERNDVRYGEVGKLGNR